VKVDGVAGDRFYAVGMPHEEFMTALPENHTGEQNLIRSRIVLDFDVLSRLIAAAASYTSSRRSGRKSSSDQRRA